MRPFRVCLECDSLKRAEDFRRKPRSQREFLTCKKCHANSVLAHTRTKRQELGEVEYRLKQRQYQVKRSYGLSAIEYDALTIRAAGVCESCGQPPQTKGLNIDHEHATKRVRGLLCSCCNFGIGLFLEDANRIQRAIDYLKRTLRSRTDVPA